jgi:hypothetical protein
VDNDPANAPEMGNVNLPLAMNRQQTEVFELLRGLSTEHDKFHEWYQGAIQVINSRSADKLAQAANSIRELCDKLPDRIADIPKFNSPVSAVKSLQRDFLDIRTSTYANGWKDKAINNALNKLLLRLEEIFRLYNEPPRTARFKLALTSSDLQAEFMSKEHREARDDTFERIGSFFQGVTHHRQAVDESEFREELELFESLILNFLTPCTAAQQHELLTLIAGAPSPEAISNINKLISHKGANFVLFFEKLNNPKWLQFLDQQGHFSNLPGPELSRDEQIGYRIHVPLITLARLAESAPQEVANILVKLKLPDNPRVGDQVLQCMAKIRDPACIRQLRPLVTQFGENPLRTSWLWIQELLKTWTEAQAFSEVFVIIDICLVAAVDLLNERSPDFDTWRFQEIDKDILNQLAPKYPFEIASSVFKALCRWADRERRKYRESELSDDGPFSDWHEDFKSPQPSHRGLEGTLAIRLFSASEHIYRQGNPSRIDELDKLLRSNPWRLFQRLRWQLYADFPALSLERARAEVLKRIPALNEIDHGRGRHGYEFAQLLIAHAKQHGNAFLSSEEVEQFVNVVFKGPVDKDGNILEDYKEVFCRKQLWPISSLLRGEQLAAYRVLVSESLGVGCFPLRPAAFRRYSAIAVLSAMFLSAPRQARSRLVLRLQVESPCPLNAQLHSSCPSWRLSSSQLLTVRSL